MAVGRQRPGFDLAIQPVPIYAHGAGEAPDRPVAVDLLLAAELRGQRWLPHLLSAGLFGHGSAELDDDGSAALYDDAVDDERREHCCESTGAAVG
ncbi:MAG: hypothetical protein HY718_02080 [Planctomycetes bacterium]|nr:hypothetical protein [Planctomycetota bacterium]